MTVEWVNPTDAPGTTEIDVTDSAPARVSGPVRLEPIGRATFTVTCPEPGTASFTVQAYDLGHDGGRRSPVQSESVSVVCELCGDGSFDAGMFDAGPDLTDAQMPPTPVIARGTHASVGATEVVSTSESPGLGVDCPYAVAAGEGFFVHDLCDGSIAQDVSQSGARIYRAFGVLTRVGGALRQSVFGVGAQGYFDQGFNEATNSFGFAFLGASGQNITHALQILSATEPEITERFVIVNNTLGEVTELVADGLTPNTLVSSTELGVAGVSGSPVSCESNADASRLVCNTDTDLFYWDSGGVQLIAGALGTGLRLMHCNAGICALPDFVAGEIVVFRWDLSGPPNVTEIARLPIPGAVSAGVRGDGMIVAPSSTTNTLHVVDLDASLAVQSDRTCAIDAGGAAPFHAQWIGDTDDAVTDQNSDGEISVVDTTTCM